MIEVFSPPSFSNAWKDLRHRLQLTRWPEELPGTRWENGFDLCFLQELCHYWSEGFDWPPQVDRFSEYPHYLYGGKEGKIHFLHVRGKGPAPTPIVLTHGWPGSFLEMLEIIPLLTNPEAHGLDSDITFDVVVPSLPGFGFSDKPRTRGVDAFRTAQIWVELMGNLGYDRFAVQGGDLGAGVSTALGLRHKEHVVGIHLNYIPGSYRPYLDPETTLTSAESHFLAEAADWYQSNGAYAHLQGTRPQTPAYALNDSPAGLAAWILEKFRDWSDCEGDLYRSFSRDALLANVTLYWMTQTIASSFQAYKEGRQRPFHFSSMDRVDAPSAVAVFPKEIIMPPRSWVERGYNVTRWTTMPSGGHFAAAEEPVALASDIQAFFREL